MPRRDVACAAVARVVIAYFALLLVASPAAVFAQELVWAKRAGGTQNDQWSDIAVDDAGNSYITGSFGGTTTLGGEADGVTLTSAGEMDVFIAKYNGDGALRWAKRVGGSATDRAGGIVVDRSGNTYVTGTFVANATFGEGEPRQAVLSSAGSYDMFVAMFDSSGALVWAKRAGGSYDDEGSTVAVDAAGNSYVSGGFGGTDYSSSTGRAATFGAGEGNQTVLNATGAYSDIFLAKYDQAGVLVWARHAVAGAGAYELGVDVEGNSYITGQFEGTATFGPEQSLETILTSGDNVMFLAKYDGAGTLLWARQAGQYALGLGLAVDSAGNSFVSGIFGGTDFLSRIAVFGFGETNETTLTGAGNGDVFVAKYDRAGALVWAKRSGGTSREYASGVAIDISGDVYVTGGFNGTAVFGEGEPNSVSLTSFGRTDVFVAKYDSGGRALWAKRAGGTENEAGGKIAIDRAGNSYVIGGFVGPAEFGAGEPHETVLTASGSDEVFIAKYRAATLPGASLALPQFVFGGGWSTTLHFSNTTGSAATVQLTFVADNGSPLSAPLLGVGTAASQTVNLQAGGTVFFETPSQGVLVTGWIDAIVPAGVIGYAVFRQSVVGGVEHEAVVPLSPTSAFAADMIYDDVSPSITAAAFINPANQPVTLSIIAYAQDGKQVGASQLVLSARTKHAVMLRQLTGLAGMAGLRGRITFSVVNGNVAVLGLRFGAAGFSTIPVVHR